uniref:Uncharacterized protein n=1 Tax=Anguilla anguilla TaxID=7936 RepID=A0A0E9WRS5_ANGAN
MSALDFNLNLSTTASRTVFFLSSGLVTKWDRHCGQLKPSPVCSLSRHVKSRQPRQKLWPQGVVTGLSKGLRHILHVSSSSRLSREDMSSAMARQVLH